MSISERVYERVVQLARPALSALAPLNGKLARGVAGRRETQARLAEWAASRVERLPLLWVHAPSVGEALMAQAIIAAVRRHSPAMHVVFTYFSPSAERIADRIGADVSAYAPWDTMRDVRAALRVLEPRALAFVRTEVWPTLAREAQTVGARVALVNAVLAPGSSRQRAPARFLLQRTYARLDAVGAVSADDAARFAEMGVRKGHIHVTGDARFDQVAARAAGLDAHASHLEAIRTTDPILVAGSTWPADESVLLDALVRLRRRVRTRLVIAPHEPTPEHLDGLENALAGRLFSHARLSVLERGHTEMPDAVVVDRVGVLADLYSAASVAYVGGGFGHAGLHSVIEPAALGVPVVFGPRHGNAREAGLLVAEGGGFVVRGVHDLTARLDSLLHSRAVAGERARAFVQSRLGGAERNARLLLSALSADPGRVDPARDAR